MDSTAGQDAPEGCPVGSRRWPWSGRVDPVKRTLRSTSWKLRAFTAAVVQAALASTAPAQNGWPPEDAGRELPETTTEADNSAFAKEDPFRSEETEPAKAREAELAQAGDNSRSDPEDIERDREQPPGEPPEEEELRRMRSDIEEILITAEAGREAMLSKVPVSATAFSAAEIEGANMTDIRDVAEFTPNLEIRTAFAASNPTLFIRGVGLNDFNANSASAVAVYQDDIYMNSPAGQLGMFFDLESVEVLRGPQGSLYGRNASAGAIRMISRKPTDEFEAYGLASYGTYDSVEVQGAVGGPLIDEYASARVAFRMNMRDGITKNRCGGLTERSGADICGGQSGRILPDGRELGHFVPAGLSTNVNDAGNWAARSLVRFAVPELEMDWLLNFHGGQNRGDATQFQHLGTSPAPVLPDGSTGADRLSYKDGDGDPFAGDYNRVGNEDLDLLGGSLTGTWALGNYTLTSISGYEFNDRTVEENTDAGPNELLETVWTNSAWQFSQELRANWDPGDSFRADAGALYLMEDLEVANSFENFLPIAFEQAYDQRTTSFAFYGHGSWELPWQIREGLTLEGGARYSWERKSFDIVAQRVADNGRTFDDIDDSDEDDWGAVTGDIALNLRLLEEANVYLKYSRGWKPGHFNGGAVLGGQLITPADPETVDSFEAGLKGSWWDQRMMLNLTGFYYDYSNLQVFQLENSEESLPLQQLINANDAQVYGIELELHTRPFDGLDIRSGFAWLESEYLDFTNTFNRLAGSRPRRVEPVVVDYSGNRLVSSPQFSWSGSAEWEFQLGRYGSIAPSYWWSFKDDVFYDPSGGTGLPPPPSAPGRALPPLTLGQEAYWLHNLRLSYRSPGSRIEVAVWVQNLTDETYKANTVDLTEYYNLILSAMGDPRIYGVTLALRF